jgi:hypothetical protein
MGVGSKRESLLSDRVSIFLHGERRRSPLNFGLPIRIYWQRYGAEKEVQRRRTAFELCHHYFDLLVPTAKNGIAGVCLSVYQLARGCANVYNSSIPLPFYTQHSISPSLPHVLDF